MPPPETHRDAKIQHMSPTISPSQQIEGQTTQGQKPPDNLTKSTSPSQQPPTKSPSSKKGRQPQSRPLISDTLRQNRYPTNATNKTFDVFFQADYSVAGTPDLHGIMLAKLIVNILNDLNLGSTFSETKKIGHSIIVPFHSPSQANSVMNHEALKANNIIAYIPEFNLTRQGIIKTIPLNITDSDLLKDLQSGPKILEATRCNRFVNQLNGSRKMTKSLSILLKFEGNSLPSYVTLYNVKIPVSPYTTQVKRCSQCLRFGHSRKHCRSEQTCNHCGTRDHNDLPPATPCPKATESPKCINCKGSHQSTFDDCPELLKQRAIHRFAAQHGISYLESKQVLSRDTTTTNTNINTYSSALYTQNQPTPLSPYSPFQSSNFPPLQPPRPIARMGPVSTNTLSPAHNTHIPQRQAPLARNAEGLTNQFNRSQQQQHLQPQYQTQHQRHPTPTPPGFHPKPPSQIAQQHSQLLISPNGYNYTNLNYSPTPAPSPQTIQDSSSNQSPTSPNINHLMEQIKIFLEQFLSKLLPLVESFGLTKQLRHIANIFSTVHQITPTNPASPTHLSGETTSDVNTSPETSHTSLNSTHNG